MMFAVKLDKPADFIGKRALQEKQGQPLRKKLVRVVLQSSSAYAWGGESMILNGETVGELSSAGWSPKAGACVAMGYVRGAAANQPHQGTAAEIDLWGERVGVRLFDL